MTEMDKSVKIFFLFLVIWTTLHVVQKSREMHAVENINDSVKNASYMRYRERSNTASAHGIEENRMAAQQPKRITAGMLSVCICALSRSMPAWRDPTSTPVMRLLVKSIYTTTHTRTATYTVTLLIGVDNDDIFWQKNHKVVRALSHKLYGLDLQVVSYPSPPQAGFLPFNALMRDAFKLNADYMVRVNDDTEFTTVDWIPLGIAQLLAFKPPNVGVVGPMCHQGNTKILTHDMVHRTHLYIFDNYYPVVFHNWFIDDWISAVYGPARTSKLDSWVVHHHVELGTRYTPSSRDSTQLLPAVAAGVLAIEAYLKNTSRKRPLWTEPQSTIDNIVLRGRQDKDRRNAVQESEAQWVVLVTVSAGFDDMFRNWLHWYRRLHLDSKVVVFAEDTLTYGRYSGVKGLDVWNSVNDTGTTIALDYDTLLYKQVVSRRSSHLLRLFDAYSHIIYTDIDTVWLRDPRPYFTGDYDLWAQLDAAHYVCTGFMALRKSKDILKLLMLWNKALMQKNQLNQPVFNSLLHETPVKYVGLSTVHFPSGQVLWQNIADKISEVVVVHNNFIVGKQAKISRFQQSRLWMPLPSDLSSVVQAQTPCSMVVQDSTAGMFSNMMGVLRALSEYSYVHVQWTQAMYKRDNNTWTQYFLPISMCSPVVSPRARWHGASVGHPGKSKLSKELTRQDFHTATRRIQLLPHLLVKIRHFKHRHFGAHNLGVHIRNTDRRTDQVGIAQRLYVVPFSRIQTAVEKYLELHPETTTIFVATDDETTMVELKRVFKDLVVSQHIPRSRGNISIHDFRNKESTPYEKGEGALIDSYLLAECDHLILTASQLNMYALFLSPNMSFSVLNDKDGYNRYDTWFAKVSNMTNG